MLFNSIEFLIFLPLVFFGYWFVFKSLRWQNLFVVAVSYLFYGWWDWRFLLLILFTSLCSYLSGVYLEKCAGNRSVQKWISAGNILLNLSILGVFKYFDFFTENLVNVLHLLGWDADYVTLNILLPVGISFYTFHASCCSLIMTDIVSICCLSFSGLVISIVIWRWMVYARCFGDFSRKWWLPITALCS